jgi:hypothetical protein
MAEIGKNHKEFDSKVDGIDYAGRFWQNRTPLPPARSTAGRGKSDAVIGVGTILTQNGVLCKGKINIPCCLPKDGMDC